MALDYTETELYLAGVNKPQPPNRIRELREARGLSQQQLADRVIPKTAQPQIDRLEKGERRLTQAWMERIAAALGVNVTDILRNPTEKVSTPDIDKQAIVPDAGKPLTFEGEYRPGPKDLPILGYVKAGDMGLFIDNGESQGVAVRPDSLMGVKDAYAVRVHDESMLPTLQPGWLLHIDPHRPCRPGDYVIIQMQDGQAFVKILERRTERFIICRQLNPLGTVKYEVSKWKSTHRVVGAKFLEE